ncbi:ethanolamine ammonia-lyase subunit EutC [Pseudoneobacillus sp. C159]
MNPELVEKVTKMILEKIHEQKSSETTKVESNTESQPAVKIWNHAESSSGKSASHTSSPSSLLDTKTDKGSNDLIQIRSYTSSTPATSTKREVSMVSKPEAAKNSNGIHNPYNAEELKDLMSKTPARIGIGRAGLRPKTNALLKFRFDHAAAVDAVYGSVNEELLKRLDLFKVNTQVNDKETYILRPDLGRKLSDEGKQMISKSCRKAPTVQIIVSDGLSSSAIEENVEDVYLSLQQSLKSLGIDTGTPFYIEKGRVAVMDDVGELLEPKVVVLLIGERPGLVSAESLSAYLCFEPRKGTIEADRMVISNIHKGGIPPVEAGAYLGTVIQKILKYEASGVTLVQKEG